MEIGANQLLPPLPVNTMTWNQLLLQMVKNYSLHPTDLFMVKR